MTGFRWGNKLDWDCKARGMCYHESLPDWEPWMAPAFPGLIRPTDVDGMVEISGWVLFIEQKSAGVDLKPAQWWAFRTLAALPRTTVLVIRPVRGSDEAMERKVFAEVDSVDWPEPEWTVTSKAELAASATPTPETETARPVTSSPPRHGVDTPREGTDRPVTSMAEIGPNLATNSDEDATEALWAEHREHTARLERTEFHLIVASWNAGRSMDWIADRAGTPERRKSRTPIRAALYRADAMGLLRRPLGGSGGRAPYLNVAEPTGDAGGQPTTEQG